MICLDCGNNVENCSCVTYSTTNMPLNEACGPDCGGCSICIPKQYRSRYNPKDPCQCKFGQCTCNQPKTASLEDQIIQKIGTLYGMGQSEKYKNLGELLRFVLVALDQAEIDKLNSRRYIKLRESLAEKLIETCSFLSYTSANNAIDNELDNRLNFPSTNSVMS